MALNISPTLQNISAFDAEFEAKNAPIFKFSWTEGIVQENELVIYDVNGNIVYTNKIQSMDLEHKLDRNAFVGDGLVNGNKYIAKICVYTYVGKNELEMSEISEGVMFYCFKTPTFEFTNFNKYDSDGIAIVESSALDISVIYRQETGEKLNSYYFELEKIEKASDINGETKFKTDTKYANSDSIYLKYAIGGMETTINNYVIYRIICTGETTHGMIISTKQEFISKPSSTGVGSVITAENIGDGTVKIVSNYIAMEGKYSKDSDGILPTYINDENGNPYAIDLRKGDYVEYTKGFNILEPYEFIVKGSFKLGKLITFKNSNGGEATLSLNKVEYTSMPYYCFVFNIYRSKYLQYEIMSSYFENDSDIVDAEIDVTSMIIDNYAYYNMNVKVDGKLLEYNLGDVNNVSGSENSKYFVARTLSSLPLNQTYIITENDIKSQVSINYIKIENGIYDEFYVGKTNANEDFCMPTEWTYDTYLHAKFNGNLSCGNAEFDLKKTSNLIVKRRKVGTFSWLPMFNIKIKPESLDSYNFTLTDLYAASGFEYEYAIVPIIKNEIGINEEGKYSTTKCFVTFDCLMLIDRDDTYSTYYNITCSQTKNNTSSVIVPIEAKYPIYVANAMNDYFTGNISAAFIEPNIEDISYHKSIKEYKDQSTGKIFKHTGTQTKYRDEVLNFLNNRKIKFIKEPFGKCWLASLGNAISDEDAGHPDLHTISFDFTEVGDVESNEYLYRFGLLDIGQEWWM